MENDVQPRHFSGMGWQEERNDAGKEGRKDFIRVDSLQRLRGFFSTEITEWPGVTILHQSKCQ
jgi:hypothetical protein